MNQIHEKDWAEDYWGAHSGMQSIPRSDVDSKNEDEDFKKVLNTNNTSQIINKPV